MGDILFVLKQAKMVCSKFLCKNEKKKKLNLKKFCKKKSVQ